MLRPLPKVSAKSIAPLSPTAQVALTWPTIGQGAIGTAGQGVLVSTNAQQPVPTASVAKIMMALTVLKKHPLKSGEQGPLITMTTDDVDLYDKYVVIDGSVVKVVAGEQLSEYQALQAALLPSANNIADTLALWAYGSMDAYHTAANGVAQSLGMTHSTFAGDASGFLPETVSTASDLVLLGEAALVEPVVREIVAQASADLPVVGTVHNVNFLLGKDGNIGIKTGNSDQAGGCFLFATTRVVAGAQNVTSVGAILGATSLAQALMDSKLLTDSFYNALSPDLMLKKDTVVARYSLPWGGTIDAVAAQDVRVVNFSGAKVTTKVNTQPIHAGEKEGTAVGSVTVQSSFATQQVPVVLSGAVPSPGWWWGLHRGLF